MSALCDMAGNVQWGGGGASERCSPPRKCVLTFMGFAEGHQTVVNKIIVITK